MTTSEVLISGASVAGPALAWWLVRRGFRPVIVERAGRLRGGGYVLAGELAAARGDHTAAYERYEQRLRPYVTGGQKQAAGGQAFLAPATRGKIRQRNLFFRLGPHLPGVSGLISRAATKTATAITLPRYAPTPRP